MPATPDVILNLSHRGLTLPDPPKPGGAYEAVNVVGNVAYVAIQFPKRDDGVRLTGRLGREVSKEDGVKAAELCALNVLAQMHRAVTFERILSLNHVDAYFQSADDWDDSPAVIDGASRLFIDALGNAGRHSRAIFGVHKLPRDYVVGITTTFTLL